MTAPTEESADDLPPRVALAFAPLHKRAFGMATGMAVGLMLFIVTLFEVARRRTEEASPLELLRQYFAGYEVSVRGAFIALLWGFATGFVMGWFVAFSRNLGVAVSLFWIRTRAEMKATRDFLDHI